MPPRKLFNIDVAASDATQVDVHGDQLRFHEALIKTRTNYAYSCYFNMILKFMKARNCIHLSKDEFFRLISASEKQHICNAKMLRSSLLFYQRATRFCLSPTEPYWAQDPDVIAYCNGAQKLAGAGKRPRGSITDDLFDELLEAFAESPLAGEFPDMADAFLLLYMLGLRWSQFTEFKWGDIHSEGSYNYAIVSKDKRVRAKASVTNETHFKLLDTEQHQFLIDLFEKRTRSKAELLFTSKEAPVKLLRKFVGDTARRLGWPSNVTFDGPHCFRHGGTPRIAAVTLAERTQMSPAMIKHYTRCNAARH